VSSGLSDHHAEAESSLWAVILAGGSGTRFWPLSTPSRPKQCVVMEGDRSLLQATFDRLEGVVSRARILVVTGRSMERAVREQLPVLQPDQFLVEPSAKNTAPAIAWAAHEVSTRGGEVMVVLPADHRVADVSALQTAIRLATRHAISTDQLVLFGEAPTRPDVGFGYILRGPRQGGAFRVQRFVEKPQTEVANQLIAEGALWNAGIFVWTVSAIRNALDRHLPGMWDGVRSDWDGIVPIAIDRGVLELDESASVIPTSMGWDDLGTWRATTTLPHASERLVAIDADNIGVHAPGRRVAVLGVEDVVIVDDGEVLLVLGTAEAHRIDEIRRALDTEPPS